MRIQGAIFAFCGIYDSLVINVINLFVCHCAVKRPSTIPLCTKQFLEKYVVII